MNEKEKLIVELSNNFTKIITIEEIKNNKSIYWGSNGIGDRFANKSFNYEVIYKNKTTKKYSENESDELNEELLKNYCDLYKSKKGGGIIGIFIYSKRLNIEKRPIREDIKKIIKNQSCVCCGSNSEIICDHKNDLYNDIDVLDSKIQKLSDFQPLCNHCNLQKRQVLKDECLKSKIYSAKNIKKYSSICFEIPWEKKVFDIKDINTKKDTYWYDPEEFNNKLFMYITYTRPIINEIKLKVARKKLKLIE